MQGTDRLSRLLSNYVEEIGRLVADPHATDELSLRRPLELLFHQWVADAEGSWHVIGEPRRQSGVGGPDIIIKCNHRVVGYVEAKPPDTDLDRILTGRQLERYREAYQNVVLTDYLHFVLIEAGQVALRVSLGSDPLPWPSSTVATARVASFTAFADRFLAAAPEKFRSTASLVPPLADRAVILREVFSSTLASYRNREGAVDHPLISVQRFLKEHFFLTLNDKSFADICAQTLVFALVLARFKARAQPPPADTEPLALIQTIPVRMPAVRKIAEELIQATRDIPSLHYHLGQVRDILMAIEWDEFEEDFAGRLGQGSPVVYFYEKFLRQYDPVLQKAFGVYYTPQPIVRFIVRSIHEILKRDFGIDHGFADDSVRVLDPAAGTGTFLAETIGCIHDELEARGRQGVFFEDVRDHVLKHFFFFELLSAPYIILHLNIADQLGRLGYNIYDEDQGRVQAYWTNTLQTPTGEMPMFPGFEQLAQDVATTNRVKTEEPILVIYGNPPWKGHSANRSDWILRKIEDYKPAGERNPKWLQNDYVKFIRWAQWKLKESTGACTPSVLAFITANSFLNAPLFSKMRKSLLDTFSTAYILNLMGDAKTDLVNPETGDYDKNVFDIKEGCCISLFIMDEANSEGVCAVYYKGALGVKGSQTWGTSRE